MSRSPQGPRRSQLRYVKPGTSYLITKKTNDDRMLLLPTPEMNQVLLYTLILEARRYGILIHAFCFMGNHFHLIVTDPEAELPAFMRQFLTDTSKAIQVLLGEDRKIWSGKRYSAPALLDLDAAERKTAYTVLNPARAGLTEPEEWPGLTSGALNSGDTVSAMRPDFYFSPRYRPEQVAIELAPLPSLYADPNDQEAVLASNESSERIRTLVHAELEEIREELAGGNATFAGPEKVLSVSREQRGSHPVRRLSPRFATRDRARLAAAIEEWRQFEADHEKARRRYVMGQHNVVFPIGTYGYRKLLGVRVAKEKSAA